MMLTDQAVEARALMRDFALAWRFTNRRAHKHRASLLGRAVYHRELARICLEQHAANQLRKSARPALSHYE